MISAPSKTLFLWHNFFTFHTGHTITAAAHTNHATFFWIYFLYTCIQKSAHFVQCTLYSVHSVQGTCTSSGGEIERLENWSYWILKFSEHVDGEYIIYVYSNWIFKCPGKGIVNSNWAAPTKAVGTINYLKLPPFTSFDNSLSSTLT